jgi:hypothetical protein
MKKTTQQQEYADPAVIVPAVQTAISLAQLLIGKGFEPPYEVEAGGLGFSYIVDGRILQILVSWKGELCLTVRLQLPGRAKRNMQVSVMPFVKGGPWIREMTDTLADMQKLVAAEKAEPPDLLH